MPVHVEIQRNEFDSIAKKGEEAKHVQENEISDNLRAKDN